MDTRILRTELKLLLRDRGVLVLLAAFTVILGYGFFNGAAWVGERSAEALQIVEKHESFLAERRSEVERGFTGSNEPGNFVANPSDPFTIGTELHYAVLPFTTAAIFAVGQSDVLPIQHGISLLTLQRTKADKAGFENPMSLMYGKFDAAFVIIFLLPLVILAMSFDLISAERESNTLAMLLSEPISLWSLLLSKIAARAVFVAVPIVIGLIVTAALSGAAAMTAEFWWRAAFWLIVVVAYAAFWFGLAVVINSFSRRSATNAVASAALWLLFVLVLPSLIGIVVSSVYPVPSRTEVTAAIRGVNLDMRRDGEKLLTEYYQDHPELLPKDGKTDLKAFGLAFVYIQQQHKANIAEVESRFAEQLENQRKWVSLSRFLSPAIAANEAILDVAGTGTARFVDFRTQAGEHDRAWNEFFRGKVFRLEKLTPGDFDALPRFSHKEEPPAEVISRVLTSAGFILMATTALFFFAYRGTRKYGAQK